MWDEVSDDKSVKKYSVNQFMEMILIFWDSVAMMVGEETVGDETQDDFEHLLKLPNFNPNDWLRRNFLIGGTYIPSGKMKVPPRIIKGYHESYKCFIYGFFSAACAMSRSVLELILCDNFPHFADARPRLELAAMVVQLYSQKKLKRHDDIIRKAEYIRKAGNESLHAREKVSLIFNEMTAHIVIKDLKDIIEFFYK
jgi:hypothetical protein